MDNIVNFLRFNLRALAPARVYALLAAIGSGFIGLGYLIASKETVSGTLLYKTLDKFAAVKPFGLVMVSVALLLAVASMRNSRKGVALWSFCNVLIWIFIGVLFSTDFKQGWFTIMALWPLNFLLALYTRYLATRPPHDFDEKFDEHVDETRRSVLNLSQQTK